jgi:hypothetical protein
MLLCLCFPSAALTLDNRLGLSEDEFEELGLTESMEDGDALETYLEHEEDRYLEHEEEMEVQDPTVTPRRRKTRKGGARRRRRSMTPGQGKPAKLGKRVKALEKKNKILSTQILKLKATVKSHSAEIPHLKGVIKKLVAAVDLLEQAIGNGSGNDKENNDENDNENNNNNDENDNDNNNNNDEPAPAPSPTDEKTTTTTTQAGEPLPTNGRSACDGKKVMEECKYAYSSNSRIVKGFCHPSHKNLHCQQAQEGTKACYIVDNKRVDMEPWDECKYKIGTPGSSSYRDYTGVCMIFGYYNNTAMKCRRPSSTEIACKEKAHGDDCSYSSHDTVNEGYCHGNNATNGMYCKLPSHFQRPCLDKKLGDTCVHKYFTHGGKCGKDSTLHNPKKWLRCHSVPQSIMLCNGKKADEDCAYPYPNNKSLPGVCKEQNENSFSKFTEIRVNFHCQRLLKVPPNSTAACKNKTLGQLCEYHYSTRKSYGGCVSQRITNESEPLFCLDAQLNHGIIDWRACHGKEVNATCIDKYTNDGICTETRTSNTEGHYGLKPYITCARKPDVGTRRRRDRRRRSSNENNNDNNNEDD